jgi:hypothetical protein
MKNIRRVGLSLISSCLLAVAVEAVPAALPHAADVQNPGQSSTQLQSVSGTISTVQRDSFTLVTNTVAPQGEQFQQQDTSRTMMFIIDPNTTVDGKLKVDANADVIYRQDTGNDIAVSVTVGK